MKVKGWQKIFHANGYQRNAGVAVLTSDIKIQTVTSDKEGRCITMSRSIQEDIAIVNLKALKIGAPQYIWQMLIAIKRNQVSKTVIMRDFKTLLLSMQRFFRQKILPQEIGKISNTQTKYIL